MTDYSQQAKNDLEILKLTRRVPVELEDELLAALERIYVLHDQGDPHPAKEAVKLIEKCPVRDDVSI